MFFVFHRDLQTYFKQSGCNSVFCIYFTIFDKVEHKISVVESDIYDQPLLKKPLFQQLRSGKHQGNDHVVPDKVRKKSLLLRQVNYHANRMLSQVLSLIIDARIVCPTKSSLNYALIR